LSPRHYLALRGFFGNFDAGRGAVHNRTAPLDTTSVVRIVFPMRLGDWAQLFLPSKTVKPRIVASSSTLLVVKNAW
jgi:hypothetical protein